MYAYHESALREQLGRLHERDARRALPPKKPRRQFKDRLEEILDTLERYRRELRGELLVSESVYLRQQLAEADDAIRMLTQQRSVVLAQMELSVAGAVSLTARMLAGKYDCAVVADALLRDRLADLVTEDVE